MVRPEKWADFVYLHSTSRLQGGAAQSYSHFRCPYECGVTIDLPSSNCLNNKASRCHRHLMKCVGVKSDGSRAEDDPRICDERKVDAKCAEFKASVKRSRSVDATSVSDTTLALQEEVTALQTSKDALASRNDGLQSQICDLQAQMESMRVGHRAEMDQLRMEMQTTRAEMQRLRSLVPLVERITAELGLDNSVLPAPPIDTYVDKIALLKKAATMGGAISAGSSLSKIQRENQRLHEQVRRLMSESARMCDYVTYWNMAQPLFDNPREAEKAIRKAISAMHPDKNHEIRTQATTLLCIFNYLLEEVRKIKNVASVEGYS